MIKKREMRKRGEKIQSKDISEEKTPEKIQILWFNFGDCVSLKNGREHFQKNFVRAFVEIQTVLIRKNWKCFCAQRKA